MACQLKRRTSCNNLALHSNDGVLNPRNALPACFSAPKDCIDLIQAAVLKVVEGSAAAIFTVLSVLPDKLRHQRYPSFVFYFHVYISASSESFTATISGQDRPRGHADLGSRVGDDWCPLIRRDSDGSWKGTAAFCGRGEDCASEETRHSGANASQ